MLIARRGSPDAYLLGGILFLEQRPILWPLVIWSDCSGFAVTLLVGTEQVSPGHDDDDTYSKLLVRVGLVAPLFALLVIKGAVGAPLDTSMIFLSFRSESRQFVSLDEPAYRKVRDLGKYAGIPVSACELG